MQEKLFALLLACETILITLVCCFYDGMFLLFWGMTYMVMGVPFLLLLGGYFTTIGIRCYRKDKIMPHLAYVILSPLSIIGSISGIIVMNNEVLIDRTLIIPLILSLQTPAVILPLYLTSYIGKRYSSKWKK